MTDHDVIHELSKASDDAINLTVIFRWLRRTMPAQNIDADGNAIDNLPGKVAMRLYKMASALSWHRQRYREFDKLARTLPEPYCTQAFDILANGKIAPWNETKEPQP